MTASRVILTGGSGFVGRHVVPLLVQAGYEVHCIGRSPIAGVIHHEVDLLDSAALTTTVASVRASHLMHLAWNVMPGRFWTAPNNLDWLAASLRLYQAFVAAGGHTAVVTGTCAEYDWSFDLLDEEMTPCRPATLYGAAKHGLHTVLRAAATQDKISLAWARLFFLYGPHEAPVRLVPDVTLSLLADKTALCGDGSAQRDFMHVEDVAAALVAVLRVGYDGPVNVASGVCRPLQDVIGLLGELTDRAHLIRFGARPAAANDPVRLAAATSILRDRIGFQENWPLRAGLQQTVDWWRASQREL